VGECEEGAVVAAEEAVVEPEQAVGDSSSDVPPCSTYEPYSTQELYVASDMISSNGRIYKCQLPPADAWCSLVGYEPGIGMYWSMAWEEVGECFQDEPEIGANNSNALSNNSASASSSSSSTTYSSQLQPCAPIYTPTQTYSSQSIISYDQHNYVCNVPIWCNQIEYAPTDGNTMSAAAWWKEEQECFGVVTATPTAFPTVPPVAYSDGPTQSPSVELGWVNLSNEVAVVPVVDAEQEGLEALAFLVEPQQDQAAPLRTRTPSSSPVRESHLPPCEPLFTQGHIYELKELISFENHNYQCEVTNMCNDVQYAPRSGEENQGMAWWKVEECSGEATRHPTPPPTPRLDALPAKRPSAPDKADIARNSYYASLVPQPILDALEANKLSIQKNVLVSQAPEYTWEYSTLYRYDDFIVALGVMTEHTLATSPFFLGGFGTQSNQEAVLYGLVNVAAFLSQSMAESIKYDTCDEANWDFVNNYYPLSNACGQGGLSYQDLHCNEDEMHMECPVRNDMMLTATTPAKWLGGADGAPGPLYCAPKSFDQPYTGVWDHLYKCNRPQEDPPEVCDVYEGQQAGRYDNSFPAGNSASRSDVEGCCWWGRGVIQTRGVCEIGKINYFLGKGAQNSPYPNVDFCEDPEALCSSDQYKELKWIAGMASWIMRVQSYNKGDWGYIPELINFVDGGMVGDSFIEAVSGIVVRGCHDDSCGTVQPSSERSNNFKMILDEVFGLRTLAVDNGRTYAPTMKPTKRTRKPSWPSSRPTSKQPSVSPTLEPTYAATTERPSSDFEAGLPTMRPTEWWPWYYNYDKQTCVNDGNQPLWLQQDDLFGIKKECCKKKVEANRYDQCMGIVTYLWTAQQSNVEISTNEEDCPPSTGWAASSDCRSYFMCQNGARSSPVYKCPANFIFDVESSECQQQSSVNCGSAGDTIAFKSEIFLASKPTGSPMESAPSPRPQHVSGGETSKAPLSSATDTSPLWFGVSVSGGRNKVQNEENKHMPQDFDK